MSDNQFIGEIRLFPYNWVPQGWFACNGQQLSMPAYTALYSIIGGQWGSDGRTYFTLPTLNGQAVMGVGPANLFASTGGHATATLNAMQIPAHSHSLVGTIDAASTATPDPTMYPAKPASSGASVVQAYTDGTHLAPAQVAMSPVALPPAGNGSAPAHNNVQPNLVLNFCICWDGMYPDFP